MNSDKKLKDLKLFIVNDFQKDFGKETEKD
jgi:hypothetical protein